MSAGATQQRAIAAAHLCDLAAKMLRGACPDIGRVLALRAAQTSADGDLNDYRWSLGIAGLSPDDIDAAVAAIARGENPPDSLPGRVKGMRDEAAKLQSTAEEDTRFQWLHGRRKTCADVLTLLGCEVPK